jgi:coiled-coil-helix-coiled-coil-helix domain-containing protein 2
MPRRSAGRAPAPAPRQQTRSSHSMAAPAPTRTAPPAPAAAQQPVQQRQPGLFAQMASTAAGVAVGSAVGHTLANGVSGLFGGSSEVAASGAPVEQEQRGANCEVDARNFTRCLDENGGNMQICDWYLQQLKACQQAARSY